MLFLEGVPLVCLEIAISQHFQDKFLLSTWRRIHPSTIGLGISAVFVSFITIVYFNIIVGWCASYFVYSLQRCLPWTSCPDGVEACTNSSSPSEYYWFKSKLNVAEDINSIQGKGQTFKQLRLSCQRCGGTYQVALVDAGSTYASNHEALAVESNNFIIPFRCQLGFISLCFHIMGPCFVLQFQGCQICCQSKSKTVFFILPFFPTILSSL